MCQRVGCSVDLGRSYCRLCSRLKGSDITHCSFIFRHREHGSDESTFASHRTYDLSTCLTLMISPPIMANLLLSALSACFLVSLYTAPMDNQNVALSAWIDYLRLR